MLNVLAVLVVVARFILSVPSNVRDFRRNVRTKVRRTATYGGGTRAPLPRPVGIAIRIDPMGTPLRAMALGYKRGQAARTMCTASDVAYGVDRPTSRTVLAVVDVVALFPILCKMCDLVHLLVYISQGRIFSQEGY